jgi:hypothetical protein
MGFGGRWACVQRMWAMFRDVRMPRIDSADSHQPHTRSKQDNLITNIHTAYGHNHLRSLWKIHAALTGRRAKNATQRRKATDNFVYIHIHKGGQFCTW